MSRSCTFLYDHFVWATWDRQALITPQMEPRLYACMAQQCEALRCKLIIVGGTADHIHALVRMRPTVCPSEVIKQMKGASSHLVTHVLVPGRSFQWQGSYGAFSVDPDGVEAVRAYIDNQKQHHAQLTARPDWERCFLADDDLEGEF